MTASCDCVFVSIPFTSTEMPLMAPAILKSIAIKAGYNAKTLDLNADFLRYIGTLSDTKRRHDIIAFFREEIWNDQVGDDILMLLETMTEKILDLNPKLVGLSVFTYNCQVTAKYLSWFIKRQCPEITVILGGAGILNQLAGPSKFVKELQSHNLIDHYIYGDGEQTLYEYLTKRSTNVQGLDTDEWKQLTNEELRNLPAPDYDDYDWSQYKKAALPILGSRGCVRHCDFCDIHSHWKKFSFRNGDNIFQEMLHASSRYGIKHFHFGDSLINGNLKEYRVLTSLLSEYNRTRLPEDRLRWSSQFIFRSKTSFSEHDWKLTRDAGALNLAVGVETLSDRVRRNLGKNFTNEDIEHAFKMAQKYPGFKFVLLFLTGHPGETDADHEFALQWWPRQKQYRDVIAAVNTGTPLGILDNTPLQINFNKLGLVRVGPSPEDWVDPGTHNTPDKRLRWNQEIVTVVLENGFKISRGHDAHYILERMNAQNETSFDIKTVDEVSI